MSLVRREERRRKRLREKEWEGGTGIESSALSIFFSPVSAQPSRSASG
jgi:hypothetical protein